MKKLILIFLLLLLSLICFSQIKVLKKFELGSDTYNEFLEKLDKHYQPFIVDTDTLGMKFKIVSIENYMYKNEYCYVDFYFINYNLLAIDFYPTEKQLINEIKLLDKSYRHVISFNFNREWETNEITIGLLYDNNKEHLFYYAKAIKTLVILD